MTSLGRSALLAGFILTAALGAATADECGDLRVPGYTADRTVTTPGGTFRLTIVANGRYERENTSPAEFLIRDMRTQQTSIVNLNRRTVAIRPAPPSQQRGQQQPYIDRAPAGGGNTQVEMGIVRDGQKVMISRAVCRPDGIFVSREMAVPGPTGVFTIKMAQTNIRPGAVDASQFQVPAGLTQVR